MELLEKAKQMYPIGTKFRSAITGIEQISTGIYEKKVEDIYIVDGESKWCIYNSNEKRWAEIIKEESQSHIQDSFRYYIGGFSKHNLNQNTMTQQEFNNWTEIITTKTMTQQEFNSLRVGDFISNYEILHKYKEFLIVKCDDGHDLFDLNKINKLGLKVTPKTFMGLEVKEYDYVPCEVNGDTIVYLIEVKVNAIYYKTNRKGNTFQVVPTSIRIL